MPSPVGHSMIGLAIGAGFAIPRGTPWRQWPDALRAHRVPVVLGLIMANAPDVDYIPGVLTGDINAFHHYYTHTLGWIVLAALGVWMIWRAFHPGVAFGHFLFLLGALSSHLVADWATRDTSYPYGIMIAWPFSREHYTAAVPVFWNFMKTDWGEVFMFRNVFVMMGEFLVTLPLVALVPLCKRRA